MAVLDDMAERLEQIRKRENLSQEAFSQRLGISRGAYQHYSRGGREIPSSVLDALLREFGTDPYWMLRGNERGPSSAKEELLVENAARIVLMLLDAYKDQKIQWDEEKLINATKFAQFYLFDKRSIIAEGRDIINKFASS
ncbi:helix-turn-helix domain-containing protein [Sphingopyxis indica]|uniref:helix-turn-helix domain-containing protein n=1 Tax=Sphingopyxis indica TaxID=436663 RepID=UPI0029391783|nr:helix-turn-helix domain-containing protein [Sphingopyxis indica]WOF43545.1 helix-turn-helix domain-containing protein [Sphingopyxis indica]